MIDSSLLIDFLNEQIHQYEVIQQLFDINMTSDIILCQTILQKIKEIQKNEDRTGEIID